MGDGPDSLSIGPVAEGYSPMAIVPGGVIHAARPLGGSSLSACFVVPGFDFADFYMPSRKELIGSYPEKESLILSLTRSGPDG